MKLNRHVISESKDIISFSAETDCGLCFWLSGIDDVLEISEKGDDEILVLHVDRISAIIEALTALQNARTKI